MLSLELSKIDFSFIQGITTIDFPKINFSLP